MASWDAIVVGLGGVGSAAIYKLASAGYRVLGIDSYPPLHDRGSSHGKTRIMRQAYFEHPDYVPLLRRAYVRWDQLEQQADVKLFHRTGLVQTGPPDGEVISGVLRSTAEHGLSVEQITSAELTRRWPGIRDRQKSRIRFSLPHYDPFFFPIALHWDERRLNPEYGSYLLDHNELATSKRTDQGLLESTWDRSRWQAKFYFDPKQGNRPGRIIHLGEQPDDPSVPRPIWAIHAIEWKQWQLESARSIWIPVFFRRHVIDSLNHIESEMEGHLRWKDTSKQSVIPQIDDEDWREPIRALFEEDWTLDYPDWLRLRAAANESEGPRK
jgi:hypothetical protein